MASDRSAFVRRACVVAGALLALGILVGAARLAAWQAAAREEEAARQARWRAAARQEAAQAAMAEGVRHYNAQSYELAKAWFEHAADRGAPNAMTCAAMCDQRLDEQIEARIAAREAEVAAWRRQVDTPEHIAEREAWVAQRRREREYRDACRKWRYQHGLPTDPPSAFEKFVGWADDDPW